VDQKKSTEKNGEGLSCIQNLVEWVNIFMEPSDYNEILLGKILYFVRGMTLLAE
jgi:hypothetical protein